MKHFSFPLAFLLTVVTLSACRQPTGPDASSGIRGQVYEIGSPAVSGDWTPPPLKGIRSITISNGDTSGMQTVLTNADGAFVIPLRPGLYYLQVKDSLLPQGVNGPFTVVRGRFTWANVDHDNGMR